MIPIVEYIRVLSNILVSLIISNPNIYMNTILYL